MRPVAGSRGSSIQTLTNSNTCSIAISGHCGEYGERVMSEAIPKQDLREAHWYWSALLLIVACCTYLHLPLVSGGRLLVPSYPTIAMMPVLFLAVRRNRPLVDTVFLAKIAFVLLLSVALSPGYAFIQEKFLSLIQFVLALCVAVLIVRLMTMMNRRSLERTLLILWCIIVIGAVLEVLDVIRGASDAFRAWAYTGTYTIYDANLRDVNLVGWLRPKLFSSEPSHATKFFIASINAWLLVRATAGKAAIAAAATVLMLVLMGSPMLLISAGITLAILAWNRRTHFSRRLVTAGVLLLFGALIGTYFAASTYSNVLSRLESIDTQSTDTMDRPSGDERRVVLPYTTLANTLLSSPLFGVGVGGKEVVAEDSNVSGNFSTPTKGNNALADIGTYLGIVGGFLFINFLFKQVRVTGVRRIGLMVTIFILFSQLMGGIDTIRYWGFIALLWGALAVADIAQSDEQGMDDVPRF